MWICAGLQREMTLQRRIFLGSVLGLGGSLACLLACYRVSLFGDCRQRCLGLSALARFWPASTDCVVGILSAKLEFVVYFVIVLVLCISNPICHDVYCTYCS